MAPSINEIIGDFKPGSIKRVRLTNFLTYSNVVFEPGARLNIVCGPNGTGKSTLLCAICLGLGGEPKTLGRADDARLFIMHEKDKAMIEIELEPFPGKDTHIFRRVIDRSKGSENGRGRAASTFLINNEKASVNDVRALVINQYSIATDNLCTFLPQDRVGNFSAFTSQGLLLETERSLANDQNLFHSHQKLIELEAKLHDGSNEVETLQSRVKQLHEENERLEREKQRMEERERALEAAQLYHKKLLWLRFDEARDAAVELKEQRTQARDKVNEAQKHVKPLEEKHGLLVSRKQQAEDRYNVQDKNFKAIEKNMTKQFEKHDKHDEVLEELLVEINSLQANKEKRRLEVESARKRLQNLELTLNDLPAMADVNETYEEAIRVRRACMPEFEKAKRGLTTHQQQLRELDDAARRIQDKLGKMNDDKARRNERIFRLEPNLRKISDWLEQNRDQFRRPVWGPIVCEVTTKSQNAAAFLEQHVSKSVFKSFVVECREDFDLLYRKVRQELKLPINIQIIANGKLEPVKRKYSDKKLDLLKKEHGVEGFLDESFLAPDAIMQALRVCSQVHEVLVGNETTQRSINQRKLLELLSEPDHEIGQNKPISACIFTSEKDKSFKYTTSISRYSNKPVIRVDEINLPKWLIPGVNPKLKEKTEDELREAHEKIDKLRPAIQEAEANLIQIQRDAQDAGARVKEAKETKDNLEKAINKIEHAKRKLRDAEDAERNAEDAKEKRELTQNLKNRVASIISALEAHAELHSQLMQATVSTAAVRINKECLVMAERKAREILEERRHELVEFEREYMVAAERFTKARNDLQRFKVEAEKEAPLLDDDGSELPLKAKLDELAVSTKEEAEAALEEATSKANSIVANPDVVRQYEERKEEMEALQEKLDMLKDNRDSKVHELERVRAPWETSLLQYVSKVNALFCGYMQELGCAGEVHLTRGGSENEENPRNFKDWGIEIRVKFRENSKLQVLSSQVHSGGERSVSTIMYLMALQELMVSPFRCVDEINQGLDERNERLVFKRIVTNSTKPPAQSLTKHSGQYFLITPKLLPKLTDMEVEGAKLLCIYNGEFSLKSPTDWDDSNDLVAMRRKRHSSAISTATDGKENYPENSTSASRSLKKRKSAK